VQPILGSTESYNGVGLELVANSSSYFKYASANGGLLDIRTNAFFLGSSASYISSSNGNLVLQSNNFFLGNSSSYVASANASMSIYTSNFSLNPKGQVTASAILVTKTPSAGTSQIMIDTTNGILDATNLGRTVYFSDVEEVYGPDSTVHTVTPSVFYSSSLREFYFQALKNEYRYTVSFMSQVTVTNTAVSTLLSALRFRLYAATIPTGAFTVSSNYAYDNWTEIQTIQPQGLGSTLTNTSGTTTYYNRVYANDYLFDSRTINVSATIYEGRLMKGVIDFRHINSAGAELKEQYKAITVTATRGLSAAGYAGFDPGDTLPPFE
jgi:hypothetical protein